ncbi:hypothetical protein FI667_g5640, partial [Globisporangium splendens]
MLHSRTAVKRTEIPTRTQVEKQLLLCSEQLRMADILDTLLDESMLGLVIIVLVVVLSTGYVYIQQMQEPAGNGGATPRNATLPPGARGNVHGGGHMGAAAALAANAIATANLTEQQMRLHRLLPSRHGARTITICVDSLLREKESDRIAWITEDTPSVLADLLQIADVYLLCVVADEKNKAMMERIRSFLLTSHPALAFDDKTNRGLKTHKILFCTTTIGKIAFVRQIEPQFHVEVDKIAVRDLEKHVPRIVHVTSTAQQDAPVAHHVADTFAGYFKLLSALAGP